MASFAEEAETGHVALLAAAGFTPTRFFFLMRRDLTDPIPDAPLPEGFEIRPVTPDQYRVIFAAENEAFRDHWGHREMGEGDYRATYDRTELETDRWVVAWAGDEVAGVVQNWVWPEENSPPRHQARLARARQRPATVAPPRPRPGDHRGLAGQAPRQRLRRRHARGRFGEPPGRARPVRGSRVRGPQPSRCVPSPAALSRRGREAGPAAGWRSAPVAGGPRRLAGCPHRLASGRAGLAGGRAALARWPRRADAWRREPQASSRATDPGKNRSSAPRSPAIRRTDPSVVS